LVTPHFKESGLLASLDALIDDINISPNIQVAFTHDNEAENLSNGKKLALFRIIQEQLKNILTHSKATKAEIKLCRNGENIELLIKDNGTGFDSSKTRRGIGLSNIYERIKFYNGSTEIKTAEGKGCLLSVHMPA